MQKDVSEADWLWRYVYLEDGTLVNAELARRGLARVKVRPLDTARLGLLRLAEAEAISARRRVWSVAALLPATTTDVALYAGPGAQICMDYCKAQGWGDVHKLDEDLDGLACEDQPGSP